MDSRWRGRAVRWMLAALAAATTSIGAVGYLKLLWAGGEHLVLLPLLLVFVMLLFLISTAFWMATLGAVRILLRPLQAAVAAVRGEPAAPANRVLPLTAILMPICNEATVRPFASIRAMYESLQQSGQGHRFDIFVLSDTSDPDVWLAEERAWAEMRASVDGSTGLYYRRRSRNVGRKSGNIADFCQRWGLAYEYMIVLDADRLMAGETLVEMVRRMEAEPQMGILQVPCVPVNRGSVLARAQQFASSVYGGIYAGGYALWSMTDGNYWGHNAIIRVRPFIECCGLPRLSGEGPLGGEILSHDFVEAALMRRAGWQVRVASDLGGSYEECPTTVTDYAKRDRRWAQGSLQHMRLVLLEGFHPISRIHMGMGAMCYLASPLWLAFLVLGVLRSALMGTAGPLGGAATQAARHLGTEVFLYSLALLLLPRLWGYLLLLADRRRTAAHGGAIRAGVSMVLEVLISTAMAPIMMAFHTTFVVSILSGSKVDWDSQRRGSTGTDFREALHVHSLHTIEGLVATLLVSWIAPGMLLWTAPVLLGLVLSIPISMALGSVRLGTDLRQAGILQVQEEADPSPVVARQQQLTAECLRRWTRTHPLDPFSEVVLDPVFNAVHIAILQSEPGDQASGRDLAGIEQVALHGGASHLTRQDKLALLSNKDAMARLHRAAWLTYPVPMLRRVHSRATH